MGGTHMFRRMLCMLLVIAMVMPMVPQYAFAVETEETVPVDGQVNVTISETTELEETEPLAMETEETEPTGDEEDLKTQEAIKSMAVAPGSCGENLTWTLDSSGVLTISGSGAMADYSMYSSPWNSYSEQITSAVLTGSITSVGENAFFGCSSLTSITIPNSVTKIGDDAFVDCSSLKNITIPDSVTSIGAYAFWGCSSLINIAIPYGVTCIEFATFRGCSSLKSISIPNSVTEIGMWAFAECINLTSITIPNRVTKIGDSAFQECSSLTSITIPGNVENIGGSAFSGCSSLRSVTISDGVKNIWDSVFRGCTSLTSVTIPNSVEMIANHAFFGCSSLKNITLPDSVELIDHYLFGECSSLTSITFSNSVSAVFSNAFTGCTALQDVYYSGSKEEWDSIEFSEGNDCITNAKIHFNNGVPIAEGRCGRELTWVLDSDGTLTISGTGSMDDYKAFPVETPWREVKDQIVAIVVEDGVETIGANAFAGCTELKNVAIRDSCTKIGINAFSQCILLEEVRLPARLLYIGASAFDNCKKLKKVYLLGSVPEIGKSLPYDGTAEPFFGVKSAVYYNDLSTEWDSDKMDSFGGSLTWIPYHEWEGCPVSDSIHPYSEWSAKSQMRKMNIYYSDSFFDKPSNMLNFDLVKVSLFATMAATTFGDTASSNYNGPGDRYIRDFLLDIGCSPSAIKTVSFENNHITEDKVAYAFGLKKLDSDYYLLPVFIRSSGYGPGLSGEWASNFNVYDANDTEYSAGFKRAADDVADSLETYIQRYVVDMAGIPRSNIKLWISGFSRGGAVANLLAAKLNQESDISRSQIYAYTFATPAPVKSSAMSGTTADNIFNIVSEQDVVPRVPLKGWGFSRYGVTYYLPCASNSKDYQSLKKRASSGFKNWEGINYRVLDGQEIILDMLEEYIYDCLANSSAEYEKYDFQDILHSSFSENESNEGYLEKMLDSFIQKPLVSVAAGLPLALVGYAFLKQYNLTKTINTAELETIVVALSALKLSNNDPTVGRALQFLGSFCANLLTSQYYMTKLTTSFIDVEDFIWGDITYSEIGSAQQNRTTRYALAMELLSDFPNGLQSYAFMQHWGETYLAWLMSGDASQVLLRNGHKIVSVKCPVDVEIRDESGAVVCRIVNDTIDQSVDNSLFAYTIGDEKYICIPDDGSFTITATAREDGTVSFVTTEYDADGAQGQTTIYADEPMSTGQNFQMDANDVLTTNGETLTADIIYSGERKVEISTEVQGPGVASGAKVCDVGESIDLLAIPNEEKHFLFWMNESGDIVSVSPVYRFMAVESCSFTAVFCDDAEINIVQSYLALQPDENGILNLKTNETIKPYIWWSAENADPSITDPVISVDNSGNVTALRSGTAYATASVILDGIIYSDRCRIDVVDGEGEHPIADNIAKYGADLQTTSAKVQLFSTDYVRIPVLLNLEQNMTMPQSTLMGITTVEGTNVVEQARQEDGGAAIQSAEFEDEAARRLFDLRVVDDRTLEIVPRQEALVTGSTTPAAIPASCKSAIVLTVDSQQVTTAVLTISVDKKLPTVKVNAMKINSFFSDAVPLTFTGLQAAQVEAKDTLPTGFELDEEAKAVIYTGTNPSASAKLNLWVVPEGWAVRIPVTVAVTVARKEPTLKLSASSGTLLPNSKDALTVKVTANPVCDAEPMLILKNAAGQETEDLNVNYENGILTITPASGAPYGATYKLYLQFPGAAKKATLTIKTLAAKALPALNLKAAGAIDTTIPNSPVTLTASMKNYHTGTGEGYTVSVFKVSGRPKTSVDVTEQFRIQINGNMITLTEAVPGTLEKGYTYEALVGTDVDGDGIPNCEKTAKLSVKWSDPIKVPVSVALKATGKIDVIRPGTSIRIVPTIKNWFGYEPKPEDLVFYTGSGKTLQPVDGEQPFTVTVENGAYVLTSNGANSTVKYSVGFEADVNGDGKLNTAKSIALSVKMGTAKLTASTKAVSLLKKDRYDAADISISTADRTLSDIAMVRLDAVSDTMLELEQTGDGEYTLSYQNHELQNLGKGVNAKLEVFLEGNLTAKPNATFTVKVTGK